MNKLKKLFNEIWEADRTKDSYNLITYYLNGIKFKYEKMDTKPLHHNQNSRRVA